MDVLTDTLSTELALWLGGIIASALAWLAGRALIAARAYLGAKGEAAAAAALEILRRALAEAIDRGIDRYGERPELVRSYVESTMRETAARISPDANALAARIQAQIEQRRKGSGPT